MKKGFLLWLLQLAVLTGLYYLALRGRVSSPADGLGALGGGIALTLVTGAFHIAWSARKGRALLDPADTGAPFEDGRRVAAVGPTLALSSPVHVPLSGDPCVLGLWSITHQSDEVEGIAKALRPALLKVFPAALLGRIVTIPFFPLSDVMLLEIIKLQLGRIQKRISQNHKLQFTYSDEVLKLVASRCSELESGGRMIDAILTNTVLPRISQEILTRLMEGKQPKRIAIGVSGGEFSYDFD